MLNQNHQFQPIQLAEMDRVKLMNRIDTKYWFHQATLAKLLEEVQDDYFILDINGESKFAYSTTYYDTAKSEMYIAHHNGKLNRFKARKRCYMATGIRFLEIKFKNNKGRTLKSRIKTTNENATLSAEELAFIAKKTPFKTNVLIPTLVNNFNRLTLVNKNFQERCTIDWNINFSNKDNTASLDNLAIVEVKSEGKSRSSAIVDVLKKFRIKSSGFSKYCVGMASINDDLKQNNFKRKLLQINKIKQA